MNKKLKEKIEKSLDIFFSAYPTWGFGKGPWREDSPDYDKMLNADGTSKVVGKSCFSPRIRMLPVYYNRPEPYQGWTIPHHYRWVLSLHSKLSDGIKEYIDPESIHEIELTSTELHKNIESIITDFLKLTNKEVIEKFHVPYYMFSEESKRIMEEVDRCNAVLYRDEPEEECKVENVQEKEQEESKAEIMPHQSLDEKVEKSLEIFNEVYGSLGFGYGNTDSPNYHKLLTGNGTSKVVGNSCFSPRIRMLPVYENRPNYGYPHHYRWVLSLHYKLTDGIKEKVNPNEIYEIELDLASRSRDSLNDIIRDFLKLTNKEVMEKFHIPYYMFSEESRKIMDDVDKRNALLYRTEESLREFRANNQVRGRAQRDEREERLVG